MRVVLMHYVYILESLSVAGRHYVGVTADLRDRLGRHNRGEVNTRQNLCLGASKPISPFQILKKLLILNAI